MHLKSGKVLYIVYREKIRTYLDIKRRQFLGKCVDDLCKAIETGIISLIDQVAAVIVVNQQRSLILVQLKDFLSIQ